MTVPYLVLPNTHGLLPVAARLKREGATVEWVPWRHRYERAWQGAIPTPFAGERKRDAETMASPIGLAEAGEVAVLTDCQKWSTLFGAAKMLWGTREPVPVPTPLRACGWWDGEALHAPHILVVDLGAWPGGQGVPVEGGATLVRGWEGLVRSLWTPHLDALKSSGHRGLVQLHLGPRLDAVGWTGGWHGLHLHGWLTALEAPLVSVLGGQTPTLARPYAVVVPVTTPPWPIACDQRAAEEPVVVPKEVAGHALWHDTLVEGGSLRVAGLDGFVCVAKGSAHTLTRARAQALGVAGAIQVPHRQVRFDVGQSVEAVLSGLEGAGWSP